MPALVKTEHIALVTWLGVVPNRDTALPSRGRDHLALDFAGPLGEDHAGLTRRSCARVVTQYPKGTEIRNTRQLSIISQEELAEIAAELNLAQLDPALLGATIVVSGISDFTHIPPGSRLIAPSGASIVVDMENRPCNLVSREIEAKHPGHGLNFKSAAKGRRGVTGWVERPGAIGMGDQLGLHIPDQRPWQGAKNP